MEILNFEKDNFECQTLAMAGSESTLLLPPPRIEKIGTSSASFSSAIMTEHGRRPQAIAHRGYRAIHPENTMAAFRGAVEVHAHAIETDIHLSEDGVVVLSHDATLKRCFGVDKRINECDMDYLSTLRTLQEPHEPLPTLMDLLEYLTTPGLEKVWVLLDIKIDDDADEIIKLIASTISEVKPSSPWKGRVVLGVWTMEYVPLCEEYLPDYTIAHIGYSISKARKFLKVPRVAFNMLQVALLGPCGSRFIQDLRAASRSLFVWTVNTDVMMKWCIRKEVDGVISDDPKRFLEISKSYGGEPVWVPLGVWGFALFVKVAGPILVPILRWLRKAPAKKV